jgi:hypothetical protein
MAQKRNLNINPYYDDFNSDNNFYKVLFKPGFPVQARELTTLQSILQNQVEDFGSHIFKEGSVVSPGGITYDGQFYAVKLNATNFGVDVSLYIDNYLGKKITGQSSGTTAQVVFIEHPTENSNVEDLTLYVKYVDSNNDFVFDQFEDGEPLIADENITYGNTTINAGTAFATLINLNATSVGSSASIDNGVYFIRGYFVNVEKQTILLDEYTNFPSYRVGLKINEAVVTAKDDNSLYDNAKGFSNYAAPGADRLKITLTLSKKVLTDFDDTDFVELLRVRDGKIQFIETKSDYNLIKDYIAERTNDESGSYSVNPFDVSVHNSLNDSLGSDGLYFNDQKTDQLNTPSDDLMCVKVSPGKAYVKGYDVETTGTTVIDVDKPRDTQSITNSNVSFSMGNLLRVNNVTGVPQERSIISLHSQHDSSGVGIGRARLYTFNVTDASYVGNSTNWDLYLYDIQTYTIVGLNTSLSLSKSSYIEGKNSGANGFTIANSSTASLTLTQTSGKFAVGEQILVNGEDKPRVVKSVKSYGIEDIKSVSQSGTGAFNFKADTFLDKFPLPNEVTELTINGLSATSPGKVFTGIKTDSIIRYQRTTAGFATETFNRVAEVSSDGLTLTLAGISTVDGVFDGAESDGTYSVTLGSPILRNDDSSSLYEKLPEPNISSVNLSSSTLLIREQLGGESVSGAALTVTTSATEISGISSVSFTAFDAERYSIHYSGGGIGAVTSDSFTHSDSEVSFRGLDNTLGASGAVVNVTLKKVGIKSKKKLYKRSGLLTVDKSVGLNTSLSGLTTSQYYGLRVQDKEISLNRPDVIKVLAIHESLDTNTPSLDQITFNTDVNGSIIGENIISSESNALARVVENSTNNSNLNSRTVSVVYLNRDRFVSGEKVSFEESNISTNITSIVAGKYKDLTNSYELDKGQREQYYDYSRIVRNLNTPIPSKKLSVIFDYYDVDSSDSGDLFTVMSYSGSNYSNDIPEIGNNSVRASDVLDFRPRVSVFSSSTQSPFDFDSRDFSSQPTRILAPNEDSLVGYEFYLGRIDKLYIDKKGVLSVTKGNSSQSPQEPSSTNDETMEVATIKLPPYLYDPNDVEISLVDNRRYTMRDIGRIEDRVETLEEVTSLSLLELNLKTLQVRSNGIDRFKSGFFVDDFKNDSLIDLNVSSVEVDPDNQELTPIISRNSLESLIAFKEFSTDSDLDLSQDSTLLDSNVQKTGGAITLKYEEEGWIEQPLATRVENVNPFHVIEYTGTIQLNPSVDSWVRTIRIGNVTAGWGSRVVFSADVVRASGNEQFMRSRNTEFSAQNIKPLTRFYQFLDGTAGVDFIPKLIEIATDSDLETYGASAAFTTGEEVRGYDADGNQLISFRLAKSNHKNGPFNNPTSVYNINPYVKTENLSEEYSQSSKVLNVDTFSLASQAQGRYSGYLLKGMQLVGQTSGSIAFVKDLRLISDNYGDLIGSFFIRNPLTNPAPLVRISTGTKTYRVTNSPTNAKPLPGSKLITSAETTYRSTGIWRLIQRLTILMAAPPPPPVFYGDPLAQTFAVGGNISDIQAPNIDYQTDDSEGAFLTAVDLFFANIPTGDHPVRVEIRTVELGTPTTTVVGRPVVLRPTTTDSIGNKITSIVTSRDGEIATKAVFPEPIYLAPGKEYAIVVIAPTTDQYELWCAQMKEVTVNTQSLPDAESVRYTKQFALGSLFKSQNGSVWTENQYQDLKFKLYKAKFTENSGTAFFYNPTLDSSNSYIPTLGNNPIRTLPKTGTIGITTIKSDNVNLANLRDNILNIGRKLSGATPNSSAFIVGTGSSVVSAEVTGVGTNYSGTISNVGTYNITGQGSGLRLTLTPSGGGLGSGTVTIVSHGNGYQTGDVVGIVTADTGEGTGRDGTITITEIDGIDTLFVAGVQGEFGNGKAFATGIGVSYYNDSGTIISMGTGIGNTEIISSNGPSDLQFSGNYFRVNHFDHGMYSGINSVRISNVESSYSPTTLNAELSSDAAASATISVASTANFDTFEGMPLNATSNKGYIKIGDEIIEYSGVGVGNLTISNRGIEGKIINHQANSLVYKYELNGVSLRRINKTHQIDSSNIDIDAYNIAIDRSSNSGSNRSSDSATLYPELSFFDESHLGGQNVQASENIEFSEVIPKYDILTPGSSTSVSASIRTVSGTSVGGNEISFVDQGFESVELNQLNKLSSPRIVCSKVNEDQYLDNLPRNKSFTTGITLSRSDNNTNLSPIIYLNSRVVEPETEFRSARLNNPITNYSGDSRVNTTTFDPHSSVYVSNTVRLKYPAVALKVFVSAYVDQSADFRVLYQLIRSTSDDNSQEFELFPGYDNLKFTNEDGYSVLDSSKNTGRPDHKVQSSLENEYSEYEFTADNIGEFIGYRIKIVMSGTNQAKYPRFKDFRSIAIR